MFNKLKAAYRGLFATYHGLIYLCIVAAVAELAYGVMNQSAIPPYVEQIGLTAHLGTIYATFLLVETIFKAPMGHLGDRLGRRPLIVGGAMLSCVTAFLTAMTTNLHALLALRALDGLACAAIWPTMIAAIGGCVVPQKRTMAMSALTVVYIAGVSFGPLVGGIANDTTYRITGDLLHSKLTSFYVVGGLFIITALVAFFLTGQRSPKCADLHEEEHPASIRDILIGIRSLPDMMLLAFIAFFAIGLMIPIVKLFAMNEVGMSETGYGAIMFPVAMVVALASIGAGHLGDKWGKVRSVRLGIFLTAVSMWAVVFSHMPWHLAAAGAALGVGFVIAMPAWLALVNDKAAPNMRGVIVGALGTAQGIGAVIGAALGSHLYASVSLSIAGIHFDPHYSPFAVSAMALTVCFVLVMFSMREGDTRRIGQPNGC